MASSNAGPITGRERIRILQGGFDVWVDRPQFTSILALASQANVGPRPYTSPTTILGTETFSAWQDGTKITLNAADITTFLAGSGNAPPHPDPNLLTTPSGNELIMGHQSGFRVAWSIAEVAAIRDAASGGTSFPAAANNMIAYAGDSRVEQAANFTGTGLGTSPGVGVYASSFGQWALLMEALGGRYKSSSKFTSVGRGPGSYGYAGAGIGAVFGARDATGIARLQAMAADPAGTLVIPSIGTNELNSDGGSAADSGPAYVTYGPGPTPTGGAYQELWDALKALTTPGWSHPRAGVLPLAGGVAKNIVMGREMPRGVDKAGTGSTYTLTPTCQAALRSWHDNTVRFDYASGDATWSLPRVKTVSILDQPTISANPLVAPYANVQGVYDDGVHHMPGGGERIAALFANQAAIAFSNATDQLPLPTTATKGNFLNPNPLLGVGIAGGSAGGTSAFTGANGGVMSATGTNVDPLYPSVNVTNTFPDNTSMSFGNASTGLTLSTWFETSSDGRQTWCAHLYGNSPVNTGGFTIRQNLASPASIDFSTTRLQAYANISLTVNSSPVIYLADLRLSVSTTGNTWNYVVGGRYTTTATRALNGLIPASTAFKKVVTPVIDYIDRNGGPLTGMTTVTQVAALIDVDYKYIGAVDILIKIDGVGVVVV